MKRHIDKHQMIGSGQIMNVTIKEVAKLANVSPSTVSRVIADSPKISAETKQVVFKAMEELNYSPNAIARSLANKSTRTLGIILPSSDENLFANPFFIQAMKGISIYAQKKGYYIMYAHSGNEDESLNTVMDYINSGWVDGIILLTVMENDKCIFYLKKVNRPFVVIGRPESTQDTLWVDNDNFQAMYNVVNYLIEKGHSNIGFIGGPHNFNVTKDRLDGYKRALSVHGLSVDEQMILSVTDYSEACGYEAMTNMMKYRTPSAVVTTDDLISYGVLKVLKAYQDLKIEVVGFNNTPLASYQTPPLSSVDINAEKLGYYAAKLLIEKLGNIEGAVNHYIVETSLIERESTNILK
jgi:DNA-binding LacI/PurR family transcriptional regulator